MQALLDSLLSSSSPTLRAPPQQGISNKGLSLQDFDALLAAICQSKHAILASRSIALLIPHRFAIEPRHLEQMLSNYSSTDSSALRSMWSQYLCALWDSNSLTPNSKDTLHAAYGIVFYFMFHYSNSPVQTDLSRLVYRLTRKVDVTGVRCVQLSNAMLKPNSLPALVALGELFVLLRPETAHALIQFPSIERGNIGSSGLSTYSSTALHRSMTKHRDLPLIRMFQQQQQQRVTVEHDEEAGEHFTERKHSIKRPKLKQQASNDEEEEEQYEGEAYLMGMLQTWDGVEQLEDVAQRIQLLEFPLRKPHQEVFTQRILSPLLALLSTAALPTHFHISRSVGRMLAKWVVAEETCGMFVSHITSQFDDTYCQLLCLQDNNTIQVSVFEFYFQFAQGLAQRPRTLFSTQASPASKPPSEFLSLWFLLSPNLLGLSNMCNVFNDMLPVYRAENVVGAQLNNQTRIQASVYFEELVQDYCRALVLQRGKRPFQDSVAASMEMQGDELGVGKSFALRAAWQEWLEDRGDEQEQGEVTQERMAAFLLWLKQQHGCTELVDFIGNVSVVFSKLLLVNK